MSQRAEIHVFVEGDALGQQVDVLSARGREAMNSVPAWDIDVLAKEGPLALDDLVTDDKSSTWVRTLQMTMGGSLLLPRVGWEVPVVYYDGDPDRALVLGRTYNAEGVVPYAQPGGKATTTLQSATSPGGGSTNELRMGDDGGKQEMFLPGRRRR